MNTSSVNSASINEGSRLEGESIGGQASRAYVQAAALSDGVRELCRKGYVVLTTPASDAGLIAEHHEALHTLFTSLGEERLQQFAFLKQIGVDRGYTGAPSGALKANTVSLRNGVGRIVVSGVDITIDLSQHRILLKRGTEEGVHIYPSDSKGARVELQFLKRPFAFELQSDAMIVYGKDDKRSWTTGHEDNAYPCEVESFAAINKALFNSFRPLILDLVNSLGDTLKCGSFARKVFGERGELGAPHTLRSYQYPSCDWIEDRGEVPEIIRVGPHKDLSLLTILPHASDTGLQVFDERSGWLDIAQPPGTVLIMAGQILTFLTKGLRDGTGESLEVRAPLHRVISDIGAMKRDRYSTPIFVNPTLTEDILSLTDNTPLRVRDDEYQMDVCLSPGLRLLHAHLRASTQATALDYEAFFRDYQAAGAKLQQRIGSDGYNAIFIP